MSSAPVAWPSAVMRPTEEKYSLLVSRGLVALMHARAPSTPTASPAREVGKNGEMGERGRRRRSAGEEALDLAGSCARRRDEKASSARGTHRDDRDEGKDGTSHDASRAKHRGCDRREVCSSVTCCRPAPANVDADTLAHVTCSFRRRNLTPSAHQSNQIEGDDCEGSPTNKISSSNLKTRRVVFRLKSRDARRLKPAARHTGGDGCGGEGREAQGGQGSGQGAN